MELKGPTLGRVPQRFCLLVQELPCGIDSVEDVLFKENLRVLWTLKDMDLYFVWKMNKNSNKMTEDEHGNMETLGDMKPAPLTSPSTHPPLLCLRIALAEAYLKVTKIWTLKSWFSQTFFESGPKPKKNIEKPSCFATFILSNKHRRFYLATDAVLRGAAPAQLRLLPAPWPRRGTGPTLLRCVPVDPGAAAQRLSLFQPRSLFQRSLEDFYNRYKAIYFS